MSEAKINTDREIWREREGDYYADSIHVTERGGIGIDCGGEVFVKPVREWHRLAKIMETGAQPTTHKGMAFLRSLLNRFIGKNASRL